VCMYVYMYIAYVCMYSSSSHSWLTALSLWFLVPLVLPGFISNMAYPRVRSLLPFYSFCIPQIYQGSWVFWVSHPTNMLMTHKLTFMVHLPQLLMCLRVLYRLLVFLIYGCPLIVFL